MPRPHITTGSMNYMTNCQATENKLSDFRRSAEWVPITSAIIASSCPLSRDLIIYPRNSGILPKYSGHVPGNQFRVGETFGNATVDAKRWLALHKD